MGLTRQRVWRCAACHRVWCGSWGHGSVIAYKGGSYVNEPAGGDPRVESDYHTTIAEGDAGLPLLVAGLLKLGGNPIEDYPEECEMWNLLQRGARRCTGVVTQWKERHVLAVRRLGGRWQHLQLLAYTIAYPELVDTVTRAAEVALASPPGR